MGALAVIGRGDVFDASGVAAELEGLAERAAAGVVRIVHRDAMATVSVHHREAGHIRRAVAHVHHVLEWDGPQVHGHVVIDVLLVAEHALVDAEQKLGFGGV